MVAQVLGIGTTSEGPNLNGEIASGDVDIAENFKPHRNYAGANRFDFSGGSERKINNATLDEWASIRDSHYSGFTVIQISDADHSIEGKRTMRSSELVHVVDFTVRGTAPVEGLAIPRGVAFFCVASRSRGGRSFGMPRWWRWRWRACRTRRCGRRGGDRALGCTANADKGDATGTTQKSTV